MLFIGKTFPVENEAFPRRYEAFQVENEVSPRRNETFQVENEAFPRSQGMFGVVNRTLPVENETIPIGNKAFGLKKGRSIEKKAQRQRHNKQGATIKGHRRKGTKATLPLQQPHFLRKEGLNHGTFSR